MSVIMIVLFAYVFFMQTMALTAVQAATRTNTDMTRGIIDRFKSMPMARSAVLSGTNFAEISLRALGLAGMVVCALALTGWRPHRGAADTAAAFGLLMLSACRYPARPWPTRPRSAGCSR